MISVEPIGNVAALRLDRAEKRNALTPTMLASLRGAIDRATAADCILLSGVGEVFCAGFDLKLCQGDPAMLPALLRALAECITALRDSPCPVVVSAHGAAIAGGCALLAPADVIVTNAEARVGYPVVLLGISPAVNTPFLRSLIGDGPTRTRSLDPGLVSGTHALRIGLAHECVPTVAECEPRALELATQLALKPRYALRATRAWLRTLAPLDHATDALHASLSLCGSPEETGLLAALWNKETTK